MEQRRIIVGIGNPGAQYARTRHNVGWRVLDRLAAQPRAEFRAHGDLAEIARTRMGGAEVMLVKPLTYVNLTGRITGLLEDAGRVPVEGIMVICDDLNLPLGSLRVRPKGSAGGHRGLASLIEALGTEEFARLRIGVGRPGLRSEAWSRYVLERFSEEEEPAVERAVARADEAVRIWITRGLEACMNFANRREP
jgi:PTH1 family peptidyl-tRNA hydrolase